MIYCYKIINLRFKHVCVAARKNSCRVASTYHMVVYGDDRENDGEIYDFKLNNEDCEFMADISYYYFYRYRQTFGNNQ